MKKEKIIITEIGKPDFTVATILSLFGDKRMGIHCYPKCFWINKLGDFCLKGEDPDDRGAKFLLDSFVRNESEIIENRIMALCYLLVLKSENEEIKKGLQSFQEDEKNKDIFTKADVMVEAYFRHEELL